MEKVIIDEALLNEHLPLFDVTYNKFDRREALEEYDLVYQLTARQKKTLGMTPSTTPKG